MRAHGESVLEAFRQARRRGPRRFGAYIVHAGALLVIVAIAVSSTMGASQEIQLREGESTALGAYTLTFVGADRVVEPHRDSVRARMDVSKNGRSIGTLYPRMSRYESQRELIGTPAVRTSLTEDLYVSIQNIDLPSRTVGLLVLVNPMVGWIWIATAVMAFGGLVALRPAWRGETVTVRAAVPAATASAEGLR
jgi:cytochrome c-type biogenesis protein CcmF